MLKHFEIYWFSASGLCINPDIFGYHPGFFGYQKISCLLFSGQKIIAPFFFYSQKVCAPCFFAVCALLFSESKYPPRRLTARPVSHTRRERRKKYYFAFFSPRFFQSRKNVPALAAHTVRPRSSHTSREEEKYYFFETPHFIMTPPIFFNLKIMTPLLNSRSNNLTQKTTGTRVLSGP